MKKRKHDRVWINVANLPEMMRGVPSAEFGAIFLMVFEFWSETGEPFIFDAAAIAARLRGFSSPPITAAWLRDHWPVISKGFSQEPDGRWSPNPNLFITED